MVAGPGDAILTWVTVIGDVHYKCHKRIFAKDYDKEVAKVFDSKTSTHSFELITPPPSNYKEDFYFTKY